MTDDTQTTEDGIATGESPRETLSRRTLLRGAGAAGATAASASLSGCAEVMGKQGASTLRYAQVLAPITLDPVVVDDPWSAQVASLVFQGLYAYDRQMNLVPVLAKGKPKRKAGGRKYAVELRTDATFQDGTRVTASDVKYTYEVPVRQNEGGGRVPTVWQVDMLKGVTVTGKHSVEFELKYPHPAFDHVLTREIVPESVRRKSPQTFGREEPIGSGPYEVEILKPGKYAVLSAWKDYWGDTQPAVEKVKFVPNHAGLARTMSMKTGQNDIVERVEPKLWDATKQFGGSHLAHADSYHYHFVGFNCSDKPMSSPKVREAVDYLISMDDFAKHIVTPPGFDQEGPTGARQHSPLPNRLAERWNMPLDEWKGIPHRKNEEEAKLLLEEAGVSTWNPLVAVPGTKSSGDKMREKLAETIVHGLKKLGFRKARTKKYPWEQFRRMVMSGDESDYAMYVGSWSGYPDPDTFLYPLFHEDMEGLTNGTFYKNDDVMAKIDEARRTTDRKKRKRAYERAITSILEDRVHLPAYTLHNSFAVKDHVEGFRPHPLSQANPRLVSPNGSVSLRER